MTILTKKERKNKMNNVVSLKENKMMRARDIQAIFNVARSTIDNWAKYGWLTRHKIGRNIFYDISEVEKLRLEGV